MSKINIKVGGTYYVRVKVTELMDDKIITRTVSDKGFPLNESHTIFFDDEAPAFSHVPYSALIEISKTNVIPEASPKYDLCHKFKAGDKVRVVENKGRKQACSGSLATVKQDEDENKVLIAIDGSGIWWVDAAYLELVTPVEELEPYSVGETTDYFSVDKDDEELSLYWKDKHPNAKAAAEAECKRLNAEYRKEK